MQQLTSSTILSTNRALDWVLVHAILLTAQRNLEQPDPDKKNSFHPMAAHSIPFIFTRHVLVVEATSTKAKPNWSFAFNLEQLIDVTSVGLSESASFKVKLGLNLIKLPNVDGIFQVRARFPKWHQEMRIRFWQYIGEEGDLLTTASESILLLRETNRKLNDIDAWGNSR